MKSNPQRTLRTPPTKRRAPQVPKWSTDNSVTYRVDFPAELNPVHVSIARTTDEELSTMGPADLVDLLRLSELTSQFSQCTDLLLELPNSRHSGLNLLA